MHRCFNPTSMGALCHLFIGKPFFDVGRHGRVAHDLGQGAVKPLLLRKMIASFRARDGGAHAAVGASSITDGRTVNQRLQSASHSISAGALALSQAWNSRRASAMAVASSFSLRPVMAKISR